MFLYFKKKNVLKIFHFIFPEILIILKKNIVKVCLHFKIQNVYLKYVNIKIMQIYFSTLHIIYKYPFSKRIFSHTGT